VGHRGENLPIIYIPEKDHVRYTLEKTITTNYFKLTLPHIGSKLKVTLWASGTPKQFILCVRSAIPACKQMEHDVKLSNAEEAVANALLDLEIKKEEYAQKCSLQRKKNKGKPGESVPAASESLAAAKTAYEQAKQPVEAVKLVATMEGAKLLNSMEIYYPMRPGSLGKRSSRPK